MNGRSWAGGAIAAVALLLAACGEGETAGKAPTKVATVNGDARAVIDEATWNHGRIQISFPDALAVIGDAVFVKTDDGHVVKVGATSGEVTADVKIDITTDPDHYCQGIGTDGRSLWACSAAEDTTDVVELDPGTLEVRRRVPVDKLFDQLTLPVQDNRVWVLAGTGDTLTAIDVDTGDTTHHDLGRRCLQLAASATAVYVTCLLSNEVLAIDANTGEVTGRVDIPGPVNVVAGDHEVWVSGSEGTLRLSDGLTPRTFFRGLTAGREGDLLLTKDSLWVRAAADFLFRIDTASDVVAERYAIDPLPSGGSLAAVGDEIWTSSYDDDLVFRVSPRR